MLKKILELTLGSMTNTQFSEVIELATSDIKTNRIDFGQRTSLSEAVEIATSCFIALNRGAVA